MELQLLLNKGAHLLHALAIDAQIAVAGAGGGAEMDGLGFVVEEKLDVVDKAQQQAGEFVMQVRLVFFDELGAGQGTDDFLECLLRLSPRLAVAKRRDGMALIWAWVETQLGLEGQGPKVRGFM